MILIPFSPTMTIERILHATIGQDVDIHWIQFTLPCALLQINVFL